MKILFFILVLVSEFTWSQTSESIRQYLTSYSTTFSKANHFYQNRSFKPFLIENGNFTSTGNQLREIYQKIHDQGLNILDYGYKEWSDAINNPELLTLELEVLLTDKIISSLYHTASGRVDPKSVSTDINYELKDLPNKNLIYLNLESNAVEVWDQVSPKNEKYLQLQKILFILHEIRNKESWQPITPISFKLKVGEVNPVVLDLKNKLSLLGYTFSSADSQVDQELISAVKEVYLNMLISPETNITPKSKFWKYINTDIGTRITEVEMQMEKARWLPQQFENRYGFVNLANQTITINDSDLKSNSPYLEFKTINGSVKNKTPSMKDKIVSVIFNPTWTMTMNIIFNEEIGKIRSNPESYFSKYSFKVVDISTGEELDPISIDWDNVTRQNINFSIVQPSDYFNALGVVKFSLTNAYSIYLHDTDNRKKFSNINRLLSHGCIRLEKPLDLAEYLLSGTEWTREKIEDFVVRPGEKVDKPTGVGLGKKSLPIYLMSLTVDLKNNKIRFFDDYYGQNTSLYLKLKKNGFLKNFSN